MPKVPPIQTGENPARNPRHPELVSGSITNTVPRQWRKAKFTSQVPPSGVAFFDQVDLPLSSPVLDLLFSSDGLAHGAKHFEMDKQVDVVSLGKAPKDSVPMLRNPRYEVRRHASVDRPAITVRHEVCARFDEALHIAQCAVRWTLKQVQGDEGVQGNGRALA